jgi:hypothetical protein
MEFNFDILLFQQQTTLLILQKLQSSGYHTRLLLSLQRLSQSGKEIIKHVQPGKKHLRPVISEGLRCVS